MAALDSAPSASASIIYDSQQVMRVGVPEDRRGADSRTRLVRIEADAIPLVLRQISPEIGMRECGVYEYDRKTCKRRKVKTVQRSVGLRWRKGVTHLIAGGPSHAAVLARLVDMEIPFSEAIEPSRFCRARSLGGAVIRVPVDCHPDRVVAVGIPVAAPGGPRGWRTWRDTIAPWPQQIELLNELADERYLDDMAEGERRGHAEITRGAQRVDVPEGKVGVLVAQWTTPPPPVQRALVRIAVRRGTGRKAYTTREVIGWRIVSGGHAFAVVSVEIEVALARRLAGLAKAGRKRPAAVMRYAVERDAGGVEVRELAAAAAVATALPKPPRAPRVRSTKPVEPSGTMQVSEGLVELVLDDWPANTRGLDVFDATRVVLWTSEPREDVIRTIVPADMVPTLRDRAVRAGANVVLMQASAGPLHVVTVGGEVAIPGGTARVLGITDGPQESVEGLVLDTADGPRAAWLDAATVTDGKVQVYPSAHYEVTLTGGRWRHRHLDRKAVQAPSEPTSPVVAVELRVVRGTWLQHRSGLQDSAKGLLHKQWLPEGSDRVALVEWRSEAQRKVVDYCTAKRVPLRIDGRELAEKPQARKGGAK